MPDPEPVEATSAKSEGDKSAPATDIDIADRVLSAAKQVTTVQEAPSIVTVIRSDEIQARGYRNITQVLENIPGWIQSTNGGNLISMPLVRGTAQAALLLESVYPGPFNATLRAADAWSVFESRRAVRVSWSADAQDYRLAAG